MNCDIIVVVPKGTRIRYVENANVDQIYVIDAAQMNMSVNFQYDTAAMLKGLPLYEPERYSPGLWPGIPDNLITRATEARRKADEDSNRDIT